MQLRGANILITGSAKRVGRHVALSLAKAGANILVHYHSSSSDAKKLVSEIKSLGVKAQAIRANLNKLSEVKKLAAQAWQVWGRVDVLINNASTFYPTPLGKTTEAQWDDLFNVNAKAAYFLSEALGQKMFKKKSGKIINMVDWAALRPYENYVPYCAAKAALLAVSLGMAKSLAPHVQVNNIMPGPVMWPEDLSVQVKKQVLAKTPLKKIGSAQDIANTIQFVIEGTDFMTGSIIHVDGGRSIV